MQTHLMRLFLHRSRLQIENPPRRLAVAALQLLAYLLHVVRMKEIVEQRANPIGVIVI